MKYIYTDHDARIVIGIILTNSLFCLKAWDGIMDALRILRRRILVKNLLFGLILFVGASALYTATTYNGFVHQSESIQSQWAQVETQYQRRADLIPNLVSSVKGYMKHERELFEELANARQAYSSATSRDEQIAAAQAMDSGFSRLLAISENYPDLRSNETVLSLMDELAGSENRVSVERMRYNDRVRRYNASLKTFPSRFIADFFEFSSESYFEAQPQAAVVPSVDLG